MTNPIKNQISTIFNILLLFIFEVSSLSSSGNQIDNHLWYILNDEVCDASSDCLTIIMLCKESSGRNEEDYDQDKY